MIKWLHFQKRGPVFNISIFSFPALPKLTNMFRFRLYVYKKLSKDEQLSYTRIVVPRVQQNLANMVD